jgi:hypothetical protein
MTYHITATNLNGVIFLIATTNDQRTKALIHADWVERGFIVNIREEQ